MNAEASEDEPSEITTVLERGVSDYIFWDFDPELTAEKADDRATAAKPITL